MFGISGGELVVILLVAALVLGPRSVAHALVGLQSGVERLRQWSSKMRTQHTVDIAALGITQEDLDTLHKLNGGELDPRRIVQQAVREEMHAWIDASSPSVMPLAESGVPLGDSSELEVAGEESPSKGEPK
ncbi:hypothetical protein U6G28_03475 [Actinomycetaceae bacterium MB13-C1-2]|nr:hypothetical protein U6G28_03475 [Actinomycetaceae bacterium MB13-C1-2]